MKGVQVYNKRKVANKRKYVAIININKMIALNCRKGKMSDP